MKKIILIFSLAFVSSVGYAQEKTYSSRSALKKVTDYESEIKERDVVIGEDQIRISKFLNGGIDDLVLNIDSSEKKEYSFDGVCKWYYCTDTKKDVINDEYTKYIVIMPDSDYPDRMNVFQVTDEVNVYHTQLIF